MSEWKRLQWLRHLVPIRFINRWAAGHRVAIPCDLFHGLPTPAMRAWIDRGESP
jgi:hypothetical protein